METEDYEDGEILEDNHAPILLPQAAKLDPSSKTPSSQPDTSAPVIKKTAHREHIPRQNWHPRAPRTHPFNDAAMLHSRKRPHPPHKNNENHVKEPPKLPLEEAYCQEMILRCPRQVVSSRVLLDFAYWMQWGSRKNRIRRVLIHEVQEMILSAMQGLDSATALSPYLAPPCNPWNSRPKKVCIILLCNFHPAILQKYLATFKFFEQSTSLPCNFVKSAHLQHGENVLPEMLFKYPKPSVDTANLSSDELFRGHELTFLIQHSFGWNDELILQSTGTFFQRNQPQGGRWELDGDLLHLKWRSKIPKSKEVDEAEKEKVLDATSDEDSFILDVLVCEDTTMHYFSTDAVTDQTYARSVPHHLKVKRRRQGSTDTPRSIRLSLVKAVKVDHSNDQIKGVHNSTKQDLLEGGTEKESKQFDYYVLSSAELEQHGFPIDIKTEQEALQVASGGSTRDRFVQTKPRAESSPCGKVYALDCEMCETDLGMELTRVTVVDVDGVVVYDELVRPQSTIINYHTEHSGITGEMLESVKTTVADVQVHFLAELFASDTILVGHSLTSDLRALRLVHLCVADTAILFPHARGFPFKTSLKYLAKTFLHRDIQTQTESGHDSAEDAVTAMELLKLKILNGPYYGVPDLSQSVAYDSLVGKLSKAQKRGAFFHLELPRIDTQGQLCDVEDEKPWQSYSNGQLRKKLHSPFRMAQAELTNGDSRDSIVQASKCQSFTEMRELLTTASVNDSADLCWVEIEAPGGPKSINDFISSHEKWMEAQRSLYSLVDENLESLVASLKGIDTLFVVIPQSDPAILRYLKGLRTQSRWKDGNLASANPGTTLQIGWSEDQQDALEDAQSGMVDSCLFLRQV
uniref:Exonuclease putative n=1 Tax=Albugo laibachii Nc14 TaxID=890382 RepID=F0WET3_9STRA|nr:exonuclease putative [Albugo laibachii Nc14]|eukprot:CCA19715.1 exonuclease putative [Albugo laibachii Nc14]